MRKILSFGLHAKGGRNGGLISVPRRGALVKRNYKFLETKRTIFPKSRIVIIEKNIYDPNRSANITLVAYPYGILAFVLECEYNNTQKFLSNLSPLENSKDKGWSHKLYHIPLGSIIFGI